MAGRVVGVSGDITLPGLGLSPEDERCLSIPLVCQSLRKDNIQDYRIWTIRQEIWTIGVVGVSLT